MSLRHRNLSNIRLPSETELQISLSGDVQYACDLAIYVCYELHPSRTKDFCWSIFGNQIVENLKKNSTVTPKMPVLDEKNGTISYLGKKYSVVEVNV